MNKRFRQNFYAVAFLTAAPLLGLSCASSEKKTELPPAAIQSADPNTQAAPAATPPPAAAKKRAVAARMVCELDKDKRTVVLREKGAGCQVTYTKFGHSKLAADSPEGTQHCDNVFDRLKQNLTAAGYACRETD